LNGPHLSVQGSVYISRASSVKIPPSVLKIRRHTDGERGMSERVRLLYIGDLNLERGGAQRHTFHTLKCIAQEFDVLMYIVGKPSQESLHLIRALGVDHVIVEYLVYENLKKVCVRGKVEFLFIQWENPQWVIATYKLSREMNVPYILLMHELPIFGTPTKVLVRNFLFEYMFRLLTKAVGWPRKISTREAWKKAEIPLSNGYPATTNIVARMLAKIVANIYLGVLVYKGVCHALNILAVSPASAYYAQMYFPFSKKISTLKIPNGVEMWHIEECWRKEDDFNYDISFMAARLVPEKGIMDLLEIVREVQQKIRNKMGKEIKVAILGRFISEYMKLLFMKRAKKFGVLKNINVLEYLPEREKFKVLHSTRVFLYPSIKDCFSISLIEAMACGCPAVVYELPFTKQFEAKSMFKTKYRDMRTMANIVSNLIMLSYEQPEEYLSLREEATNFARRFEWSEVCKNEVSILKHIISHHRNVRNEVE
jgi:glycosyltransferase involved in cell wall biosynthesis